MKIHFLFAAMAMTALFTACSNDDDNLKNENEGNEVTFVIGGVDSRITTTANFTTTFVTDDAIGISGTNLSAEMENVKYNVTVTNGSATITADEGASFTYTDNTAVFNAYYPYDENFNNSFSVQTDQTGGIASSDFLTATDTGSNDNAEVTLEFSHRMALVQVTLNGLSNISSVTLKNAKTTVAYTASNDGTTPPAVETQDATSSDITMYPQTANSVYWAIIPAQELAVGALIQVTTNNGDVYTYTTSAVTTIEANSIYKYSLSVAASGEEYTLVSYNSITIKDWNSNNEVTTGSMEKVDNTLNVTATLPSEGYTWLTGGRTNMSSESPWAIQGLSTYGYDSTTESVKFTSLETVGSAFYNQTLYYYAGEDNYVYPGKTYKISFKAKASVADSKLRMFVCQKSAEGSNNNVLYARTYVKNDDSAGTTTYYSYSDYTIGTDFSESTNVIDPSKYLTSTSSFTSTTPVEKTTAGDIVICFVGWTASTDFYIKDITITEVTE